MQAVRHPTTGFLNPRDGNTGRYVTFTRTTDGVWGMYVGSDHHLLSYTYANFDNCA